MKTYNTFLPAIFVVVLLVAISGSLPIVQAQDISWTDVGSGLWTNAASWSLGVAPSNNHNVNITSAGSKTVTIDAATTAANLTITNLNVWSTGSSTNTLSLSGDSTPLNVLGGINLGSAGVGVLVMNSGQLVATNSAGNEATVVGYSGVGNMMVSGGQWLANQVIVGNNSGSLGTLTINGGTNVFSFTSFFGGPANSTGIVLMTGGQMVTTNSAIYVSYNGGVGSMTVSGGQWLAGAVYVGVNPGSSGTLNISGGTNVLAGAPYVGYAAGATGVVNVMGGQLVTTNSAGTLTSYVGGNGVGSMTVSNGQWLANTVMLGSAATGRGTLTIDGGQVAATSVVAGGVAAASNNTVWVTGGVLEANALSIAAGSVGNVISNSGGVYQFSTSAPTIATASGSIVLNGGMISFRGIANANVKANWSGSQLTNIIFQGNNTFRLNAASNTTTAQDYTFGMGLGATNYVGLEMINGATAWRGGSLTIGNGGTLLVSNTTASIAGVVTNSGRMTVMNGAVVYGGNVVNQGAYVSDPSTNTFNGTFTVGPTATVAAAAGDVYAFGSNFVMSSTNRAFDMHLSQAVFSDTNYGITTGNKMHTFDLTGSGAVDMGSNGFMNVAQLATNFSIGTLSIALSNNLTVTGTKIGSLTNALYVGWLDLSAWNTNSGVSLTNTLQAALSLPNINLYYDASDSRNAYLQDASYVLWGGGGLLISIPEPSALSLTLAAGAVLLAMIRHRGRMAERKFTR